MLSSWRTGSESESTELASHEAIHDLEQQRRMLERENEERKTKLKKLKEEEKAAKEALSKNCFSCLSKILLKIISYQGYKFP